MYWVDMSLLLAFVTISSFYHENDYIKALWYGMSAQYCHNGWVFDYLHFTKFRTKESNFISVL